MPTLFGLPPDYDYDGESAIRSAPNDHSLLIGKAPHPSIAAKVIPLIKDINLLNIRRTNPLLPSSVLKWFEVNTEEQVLPVPGKRLFRVRHVTDGWKVIAEIGAKTHLSGPFQSLDEAIQDVEGSLHLYCIDTVRALYREQNWIAARPATPLQGDLINDIVASRKFTEFLCGNLSKAGAQIEIDMYFKELYGNGSLTSMLQFAAAVVSKHPAASPSEIQKYIMQARYEAREKVTVHNSGIATRDLSSDGECSRVS